MTTILTTIMSVLGSLGGFELIKYLLNRKTNARKAEAEADGVEFHLLQETITFLQQQIKEKEERFAEQTDQIRQLNKEVLELTQQKAAVELDLQQHRCMVPNCKNRQPQNGY